MKTDDLNDGMHLEVRSTGVGGWIVALLNGFFFNSVDPSQKGPRTVLVNRFGCVHTVKEYRSRREAIRDSSKLSNEIDQFGFPMWAEEHGIPPNFQLMRPE